VHSAGDSTPQGSLDASTLEIAAPGGIHVIVGLGNPGAQFGGTRHNVGRQVLDVLARDLGSEWKVNEHGSVALAEWHGGTLYLLKPGRTVNESGIALRQFADGLRFSPAQWVLVHDDIHLPLGTIRTRPGGRDGGHRGVRSIHEAFGTDAIPRVKIGVGKPADGEPLAEFVLRPFTPAELSTVEHACREAAAGVLALIGNKLAKPAEGSAAPDTMGATRF
jgi:PTH1 family peptidyl-tRNA hydrolase